MPGDAMDPLYALLRRPLLHVAVFSFFVNLLLLAPAIFLLQVFDRVLASGSMATLIVLLAGVGIALTLLLALDYLRGRLQGVAGNVIGEALSPVVVKIIVAHRAKRSGRPMADGLRDIGSLRALFSSQGLLALFDAPWAVIYLAVIWLAHPLLGMGATAAAIVMFGLAIATDVMTRRKIESLQKAAAGANRHLETSLANAEMAQALGMTDALIARWRRQNCTVSALQRATATKTVAMAALTRTLRQAVQVGILAMGAWLVISAQASPGVIVACTVLLGRALAPVEQVLGSWKVLVEGRAALRRLGELLARAAAEPKRMPLPAPRGLLVAHQLVYRPVDSEKLLLAGVSMQLEPGESLAIIGPSGAGKSTLLRLLIGVWAPAAGSVRLDHADLTQWPREELAPWIGYVPGRRAVSRHRRGKHRAAGNCGL
jgi:ABC-type protease/lipase transport system fused ATPase/permease subunit